jgi:hypothetical protein
MNSSRQWSLGRMFFWVLFAALICSHLSRIYHSTLVGLNDFTISDNQVIEWISELDPSVNAFSDGLGATVSRNEINSEFDFWISAEAITAEQALSHLRDSVASKAETQGWEITGRAESGDERFHLSLSKGATRFQIYCWAMTSGKSSPGQHLVRVGKNVFRVMVLQIGYTRG